MHCTGNAPLHWVRARSFALRPVQRIVAPDHGGIVHELLIAASVQTVRSLQTVFVSPPVQSLSGEDSVLLLS